MSHSARILVMDDEELVCDITRRILERLGHTVEIARSGEEAIEKYQEILDQGGHFDCLIMDLTVPGGMGGREALDKILALDPGATALVSSGYGGADIQSEYIGYGFKGVIAKPFTMSAIEQALNAVLAAE